MTVMIPATGLLHGGKIDARGMTDRLNQLGNEGWELVSVFATNMWEGRTRDGRTESLDAARDPLRRRLPFQRERHLVAGELGELQ